MKPNRNEEMAPRMAGMKLGMGPYDMQLAVSNPSEITRRLRYQEANPQS